MIVPFARFAEMMAIYRAGFESRGLLQAGLFLSRPANDVRHASLDDIVTISVGRNRPTGPRYVHVPTVDGQQVALEP